MWHLAEYRRQMQRLADALPWAGLLAPDVLLNKDGGLLATLRFRGPDLESATAAEQLLVAARLNNVFKRLRSGWALWFEAQRRPATAYPMSVWPNPVSALIE